MRRFNTTGVCVKHKHFMANIDEKLNEIIKLIDRDSYFTINRPRQYGKTTTLNEIKLRLREKYIVISISFEGIGNTIFTDENKFSKKILDIFSDSLEFFNEQESLLLRELSKDVEDLRDASKVISKFVKALDKEIILFIDEVDKSSNNELFLSFLGMLRNKYLDSVVGYDYTFKSVILAGVHDIKTLKFKLRPDEEKKYNSPWNIAVDFNVDMSFNAREIETMLLSYANEYNISIDTRALSERVYLFTSGYPFLVSRLCQIIDEGFYEDVKKPWGLEDVDRAVKSITNEVNTLFESLITNMENNKELFELVKRILLKDEVISFNALDPLINLGITYGFFKNGENRLTISNKIFEEILYNYMVSKSITSIKSMSDYNFKNNFITEDNGLNVNQICERFQSYMKEKYSNVDRDFIEREGRLIFMAFIAPIINGVGFAFKEAQVSEEKRLDIVITYNSFKYIIELKIWRGAKYHEKGLVQLKDYLDIHNLKEGCLVSFNFNRDKEYIKEMIDMGDKRIFSVMV